MEIHNVELVLILLSVAITVTAIAKKANKPYPIALIIIGALIGLIPIWKFLQEITNFFATDEIFYTAVLAIFLPALLGEASLKLSFQYVNKNRGPIIRLALIGTFISYIVTGSLSYYILELPLQTALVFAALLAPTDPVSVLSIFKSLGVTRRLAVLIEGESLINDGIAVVIFKISAFSLASIISQGTWGAAVGIIMFLKVILGGLIVGLTISFIFSQVVRYYDDYPLENAISVVLFYGVYFIAEYFELSGVIAVVSSGLVFGNYGKAIGMTPTTKLSITVFWDTVTLVVNSLVFILVGLEIARINMLAHITYILFAILFVLIGRSASVYISTMGTKLPYSWKHILNWGGLKGSLSLALALSLPASFTGREEIIALTFGVVFFSLIIQGLTIAPLIEKFKAGKTFQGLKDYERLSFELQQALAAKDELNQIYEEGRISPPLFKNLESNNAKRITNVTQKLHKLYDKYPALLAKQELSARKKMLYAEHHAIEKMLSEDILSEITGEEKKNEVLEHIEALEENKPGPASQTENS
ncbi:MAG: sodium:proton antiporter [Clostridiales bacterium]|nr:sodium:proton antiporter [Clostridiales bacterium]MCF8023797.1 sodium:proton antiporter [Clostridiales bacterium]